MYPKYSRKSITENDNKYCLLREYSTVKEQTILDISNPQLSTLMGTVS